MQLFTGASSSELQHFHYTQGSCFASFSQQKKAKLLWDTAEVWPAAFYPKIICIQWRLSKYEGHTKLLLPASETPEENTSEWGKCLIAHLLSLVSQATHFASLFQFFFCERIFFFNTILGFCTQSQWMGFFHTSKQFSDTTRWVSYNLTHLSDTIYLKIPLDPTA